jgi:secondary thiamine-phosphate synthase enzyme
MTLKRTEISLPTTSDTDILDLTPEVAGVVSRSGVRSGWALVFVPGSTGAVTTIEFESGCLEDLREAVERLVPRNGEYAHNLRWGDGNGYSHVRAALLGPSLTVPIHDGSLALGTWQQIVLCDFDNRPRQRRVLVEIFGE